MPTYSVRAYVKVRGKDAFRRRTEAEIDAEVKRQQAKAARKRQHIIDRLKVVSNDN
jgi:hypothetical protein